MSKLGLTFEIKIYIHFSNEETKVKSISIPFNQTITEGLLWAENYGPRATTGMQPLVFYSSISSVSNTC